MILKLFNVSCKCYNALCRKSYHIRITYRLDSLLNFPFVGGISQVTGKRASCLVVV